MEGKPKKVVQRVDPIVTEAIRRQVEIEATVEWALKPSEPADEAELRKELPTGKGLGHAFPLQIIRYLMP